VIAAVIDWVRVLVWPVTVLVIAFLIGWTMAR
jgi:hypothetical protein